MMDLWAERSRALEALKGELAVENALIERAFQLLEDIAQALPVQATNNVFGSIAALVTAKGLALGRGTWSLMLDSLGQEAGAISRPWVEAVELLMYLRKDPAHLKQVVEGTLPSAGERAKAIGGFAKPLRDHWNLSASHIGTEAETWAHMFNLKTATVKTRFRYSEAVLRGNMKILFGMLAWNITEASLCLRAPHGRMPQPLARQVDSLISEDLQVFDHPSTELPDGGTG